VRFIDKIAAPVLNKLFEGGNAFPTDQHRRHEMSALGH
jgi:hypothetical protein